MRCTSGGKTQARASAEEVLLAGTDRDEDALALGGDVARVDADDDLVVTGARVDVRVGERALEGAVDEGVGAELLDDVDLDGERGGLGLRDDIKGLGAEAERDLAGVLGAKSRDRGKTWTEPTITRVIAASQGQGAQRRVRSTVDAAAEAFWGSPSHPFIRESFMDARDLDTASADQLAELDRRMADALARGAATAGAKITLADTAAFSYGTGYQLGDVVDILLDPALPVVRDRIRSVIFEESPTIGFSVRPTVGDVALSPALLPILLAKRLDKRVGALERI